MLMVQAAQAIPQQDRSIMEPWIMPYV